MSDSWAGFGQVGKSRACTRGAHAGCAHFVTMGGGFNPRRLRLEFGAGLCPCSCHSPCPVTVQGKRMTVRPEDWRESCTCPGAEEERRRFGDDGFPDFGKQYEEARQRSRARREAFESARSRAAGKTDGEIREIYLAELNARGQAAPKEEILQAVVARIRGNPLPAVRVAAAGLAQAAKALHEISRMFRSGG